MAIGRALRLTLFGESHGCCVGFVLEGVPPGIPLSREDFRADMELRRPGRRMVSPRREADEVELLSGIYMGYTTGAPLAAIIRNRDIDSSFYEEVVRYKPRPGHADVVARLRYMGFNDYRGGGVFSGRITAAIVAAGVIAKKIAGMHGIGFYAFLERLGSATCPRPEEMAPELLDVLRERRNRSPVFCHDGEASRIMEEELVRAMRESDSLGGVVEVVVFGAPPGLGDPPLNPLDADMAKALFTIPGVRGVEFGLGFEASKTRGSESLDRIRVDKGVIRIEPGHGGGVLGGLSSGSPIVVRVAFKPTSTIPRVAETIDWRGLEVAVIQGRGRHDPAIAVRAVPVVEAVTALVVADHLLQWLSYRLAHYHWLEEGAY